MTAIDIAPSLAAPRAEDRTRPIAAAIWLGAVTALVFVMIVVGGMTRLTDSGLSITEWRPVTGAIPPLSQAGWESELEKYRATTEYQIQNRGMSMADFKVIYWWEWGHRQLGRLIGLAMLLPLAVFWIRGWIPPGYKARLATITALIGVQGAVGWWMVASGLVDRVDVSHYRLATHLGLAFILFGLMAWTTADLWTARRAHNGRTQLSHRGLIFWATFGFAGVVFVQILSGALVAGLDAGRIHTGWPLVDGRFIPVDYGALSPWWTDAFENRASVQTHHRLIGYLIAGLAPVLAAWVWLRAGGRKGVRAMIVAVMALVAGQVALGVITLVNAAPVSLSAAHQAMAAILFAASLLLSRQIQHSSAQPEAPR